MPKGTRALILGLLAADALVLLTIQALVRFAGARLLAEPPAILETAGGHLLVAAVLTAYVQGVFALNNLYHPGHLLGGYREYAGVVKAATYAFVALGVASLLAGVGLQREGLVLSWALTVLAVGPARFVLRRVAFRLRRRGLLVQRLLVVGADEHALALARELNSPEGHGLQVVGFLDDFRPVGAQVLDGLRVLGDPRSAVEVCRQHDVRRMVLVPHAVSWESLRDLLEMAAARSEFRVEMAPGLDHLLAHSPRPVYDGVAPLITLEPLCIRGLNAILRRVLDLCLAVALLPFLGALLVLCWLASRLDGGGPVLVRRRALGRAGRVFLLLALAGPSSLGAGRRAGREGLAAAPRRRQRPPRQASQHPERPRRTHEPRGPAGGGGGARGGLPAVAPGPLAGATGAHRSRRGLHGGGRGAGASGCGLHPALLPLA